MAISAIIAGNDYFFVVLAIFALVGVIDRISIVLLKNKARSGQPIENEIGESFVTRLWHRSIVMSISNPLRMSKSPAARSSVPGPIITFCILAIRSLFVGKYRALEEKPSYLTNDDGNAAQVPNSSETSEMNDRFITPDDHGPNPENRISGYGSNDEEFLNLDPPPTPEEYRQALLDPWPGHTPEETIARKRSDSE